LGQISSVTNVLNALFQVGAIFQFGHDFLPALSAKSSDLSFRPLPARPAG